MISHEWNSVINIYANMNISGGLQANGKHAMNIEFLQICFFKFTFPMCEMRNVNYLSVLG